MTRHSCGDAGIAAVSPLFLILLFFFLVVVFFIFLQQIAFLGAFRFILVILIVLIIRNEIEVHGMRLGDFEFRFALGTAQNLPFFNFIFIDIDFRGTFRATDHGTILRIVFRERGVNNSTTAFPQRIIYRGI